MSIRTDLITHIYCDCCSEPLDDFTYYQGFHHFIHTDEDFDFCRTCWNHYPKETLELELDSSLTNPIEVDGDYYDDVMRPKLDKSYKEWKRYE